MHAYFSLAEQYMHKKYLLALKPSTFKDGMSMKTIISPLKIFRERFKKRCCRDTGSLYELLPKLLTPLTFVLRPLNHPHRPTDTWLGRHSESAKTSSQLADSTHSQGSPVLALYIFSNLAPFCKLHLVAHKITLVKTIKHFRLSWRG